MKIIGADTKEFSEARNRLVHGKYNGAYFYAKEILFGVQTCNIKRIQNYKCMEKELRIARLYWLGSI